MAVKIRYDDCPYNCNAEGKILDEGLKAFVPCPYCSKKRNDLVRSGEAEVDEVDTPVDLAKALGIEKKFLTDKFVYSNVIPEGELLFIEDDTIENQRTEIENLCNRLAAGDLPDRSICFGISIKGKSELVAYPILCKAIKSGFSVCPFMSCSEFNHSMVSGVIDVMDFYKADLVVMLLNEGATKEDLSVAKGLMQTRGIKNKPTIFLTTWSVEACSVLLGYHNKKEYSLATPIFLEYHSSKKKGHTKYINQLLGVENGVDLGENSMEPVPTPATSNPYKMSFNDLK